MNRLHYVESYQECLAGLRATHGEQEAMELVVGGEYERFGVLEEDLLLTLGLKTGDALVDVGCGTGRLSSRLARQHHGKYVGTDILPELVDYARRKAGRPDWEFHVATEPPLPVPDASADWVTFFSVFTHLLNEDIYRYLADARRALKPSGRIVFSFLDFDVPNHWPLFADAVADRNPKRVLTNFLHRRAIDVWASKLGLALKILHSGDDRWIASASPEAPLKFGQSIAVLVRDDHLK